MSTAAAHKTAIRRVALSRPVALALDDGLVSTDTTFFDYGCGRGGDLLRLHKLGVSVAGWDPAFFPEEERTPADIVNLGYVVNVIEDPDERAVVLGAAWELARKMLIVSARLDWDSAALATGCQGDGVVTSRQTFQKFYTQEELRDWITSTLGCRPVAAAPGVFYVFRDAADEQTFAAARVTRRRGVPTVQLGKEAFERYVDLLEPLMAFVSERGRFPTDAEIPDTQQIKGVFGSIARAFVVVRAATGSDHWEKIRTERVEDTLVYLAQAAFGKRPRFGHLPEPLRHDIRAFFGTYKKACTRADRLLFSAGNQEAIDRECATAPVGKLLPDALYVHHTALEHLSPLLRVFEECGRQLVGAVEGVTLIKFSRRKAQVSYLVYEDFDRVPHPALQEAIIADLRRLAIHHRDYRTSQNPPILHRKELFVADTHPSRNKFSRLTARETALGLLGGHRPIGRKNDWLELLSAKGVAIRGHRVVVESLCS